LMPVFEVKSEGVSFAMSFICGLSTIATLIEPPVVPDAGVPLAVPAAAVLLELPPPQPAARIPTTASRAVADPRRTFPLM
jgi:hypothetical protein